MTNNRPLDDRPHYGQRRHRGRAVAVVAARGSSGRAGQGRTAAAAAQGSSSSGVAAGLNVAGVSS